MLDSAAIDRLRVAVAKGTNRYGNDLKVDIDDLRHVLESVILSVEDAQTISANASPWDKTKVDNPQAIVTAWRNLDKAIAKAKQLI